MTKIGIYVVLRLGFLLTDPESGELALFGQYWLLVGGIATVLFGMVGMLASQDLAKLAGFSVLVSSGTLLAVLGPTIRERWGRPSTISPARRWRPAPSSC